MLLEFFFLISVLVNFSAKVKNKHQSRANLGPLLMEYKAPAALQLIYHWQQIIFLYCKIWLWGRWHFLYVFSICHVFIGVSSHHFIAGVRWEDILMGSRCFCPPLGPTQVSHCTFLCISPKSGVLLLVCLFFKETAAAVPSLSALSVINKRNKSLLSKRSWQLTRLHHSCTCFPSPWPSNRRRHQTTALQLFWK